MCRQTKRKNRYRLHSALTYQHRYICYASVSLSFIVLTIFSSLSLTLCRFVRVTEGKRKVENLNLLLLLSFAGCWRSPLISGLTLFTSFLFRHCHHYLSLMTTLTIYFVASPRSPVLALSSTNTNITTTIQPTRIIQNLPKPKPILSPVTPSITLPIPSSPTQTPSISRTSSKRNKTFFERFNDTASLTHLSSPQSPTSQQQQSIDSSNPSLDPPPRLRRRFTFRRSLRHSTHNNGGDIDDGIRSVLSFSFVNFSLCRYLFYTPSK